MASFIGTNTVKEGLVFHMDLENGAKSWKGKPTTNLLSNPDFATTVSPWSFQTIGDGEWEIDTVFTKDGYNSVKLYRTTLTGEVNLWLNLGAAQGLSPNTEYTFSVDAWAPNASQAAIFSYFSSASDGFVYHSGSGQWERLYHTFTTRATEPLVQIRLFHNATTLNTPIYFAKPQVELGNIGSKWVNGTRLDTASIIDVSGFGKTITPYNMTYREGTFPIFDGANDYTNIDPTSIPTASSITFDVWAKINTVQASSIIEAENSAGGRTLNVHLPWSDNNIFFDAGGAEGTTTYNRLTYATTTEDRTGWHNWVFTKDIATGYMRIYRDGVKKAESTGKTIIPGVTTAATIGSYVNGLSNFYNGEISQAKIYSKALTQEEITANFEATRARYGV